MKRPCAWDREAWSQDLLSKVKAGSHCSSARARQKPDTEVSPGACALIIHVVCMHKHVYVRIIPVCILARVYHVLVIINYS